MLMILGGGLGWVCGWVGVWVGLLTRVFGGFVDVGLGGVGVWV